MLPRMLSVRPPIRTEGQIVYVRLPGGDLELVVRCQ